MPDTKHGLTLLVKEPALTVAGPNLSMPWLIPRLPWVSKGIKNDKFLMLSFGQTEASAMGSNNDDLLKQIRLPILYLTLCCTVPIQLTSIS